VGPAGGFGALGAGAAAGGAGGAGCAGAAGAAGGAGCGAGAAAGGAGRGAAGGGGGAGCGGAAAGGGAGRAGGGPAFGGCLGGCLGFPSGPSSSLACATTIGAVCACAGGFTNCIAVRAVVASSTSRSFVMMVLVPGKYLTTRCGDQRISVGPDCGGLQRRTRFYFVSEKALIRLCSLRIQAMVSNRSFTLSPAAVPVHLDSDPAPSPANHRDRRRSRDRAYAVLAARAPVIRPADGPAIPPASVLHRDRASAAVPQAADFRAGFLAAAPTVVRA